jgi:hypothetical protein
VRRSCSSEKHPLAAVKISNSVSAADHRELARTGVVRATGQLLVDRLQRRGAYVDNDLAVASDWLGKLLTPGRLPERMKDRSKHTVSYRIGVGAVDSTIESCRLHYPLDSRYDILIPTITETP